MYEVTDNISGDTSIVAERAAEKKYGSEDFTMMVAGLHPQYSAINLSVAPDLDDCSDPLDAPVGFAY